MDVLDELVARPFQDLAGYLFRKGQHRTPAPRHFHTAVCKDRTPRHATAAYISKLQISTLPTKILHLLPKQPHSADKTPPLSSFHRPASMVP